MIYLLDLGDDLLFYIIDNFSSPIEKLLIIRRISKKFKNMISIKKIFDHIKKGIVQASNNTFLPHYWNNLEDSYSFIAGSALIHALHETFTWKPNDIDVWTSNLKELQQHFNVQFEHKYTINGEQYPITPTAMGNVSIKSVIDSNININEVYFFTKSFDIDPEPKPVNHIIVSRFDYEFLRAWFDGKTLKIYHPEQTLYNRSKYIHVKCIEGSSMGDKYHNNATLLANQRFEDRYEKYVDRGFSIKFEECGYDKDDKYCSDTGKDLNDF